MTGCDVNGCWKGLNCGLRPTFSDRGCWSKTRGASGWVKNVARLSIRLFLPFFPWLHSFRRRVYMDLFYGRKEEEKRGVVQSTSRWAPSISKEPSSSTFWRRAVSCNSFSQYISTLAYLNQLFNCWHSPCAMKRQEVKDVLRGRGDESWNYNFKLI